MNFAVRSVLALTLCAASAVAAVPDHVDIFRTQGYSQTTRNQPKSPSGYFGAVRVFLEVPGDYDGGTITNPSGAANTLSLVTPSLLNYASPTFTNITDLNLAFPTGPYSYYVTQSAGTNPSAPETVVATLPPDQFPTSIPYLTNYSSLKFLTSSQDFTLTWNSFAGANGGGVIFVSINRVIDSALVFTSGGLPIATTSLLIPANTLTVGTDYVLTLVFSNRLSGQNSSGNTLSPPQFGYDFSTQVPFSTRRR